MIGELMDSITTFTSSIKLGLVRFLSWTWFKGLQFFVAQPLGAAGLLIIIIMLIASLFAQYVSPFDPVAIDFGSMLAAPSSTHWMGTDQFGRDILTRIIYGARTALSIGFWSSFIGCTLGAAIGIASAYFGGKTDLLIQRFVDILLSFPIIVLAVVVVAMLGSKVVRGCCQSEWVFEHAHHVHTYRSKCDRSLSHHSDRLHSAGDFARSIADFPRSRR